MHSLPPKWKCFKRAFLWCGYKFKNEKWCAFHSGECGMKNDSVECPEWPSEIDIYGTGHHNHERFGVSFLRTALLFVVFCNLSGLASQFPKLNLRINHIYSRCFSLPQWSRADKCWGYSYDPTLTYLRMSLILLSRTWLLSCTVSLCSHLRMRTADSGYLPTNTMNLKRVRLFFNPSFVLSCRKDISLCS